MISTSTILACSQRQPNKAPSQASQRPRTQLTTMAGFMMMVSSRRSITLNVSDCLEAGSASQW